MNCAIRILVSLLLLGLSPVYAGQQEKPVTSWPLVHLQAEARSEIANDLMIVRFESVERGKDTAELANIVNSRMKKAVELARQVEGIQIKTTSYRTSQWWEKGKQKGWIISQELELKGTKIKALSQLAGKLQAFLHIRGMWFEPSRDEIDKMEDKLIAKALEKFKQRAAIAAKQLGYRSWWLKDVSISTSGRFPTPVPVYRAKVMAGAAESVAAPEVSPGTNQVKVSVSGTIELLN